MITDDAGKPIVFQVLEHDGWMRFTDKNEWDNTPPEYRRAVCAYCTGDHRGWAADHHVCKGCGRGPYAA